ASLFARAARQPSHGHDWRGQATRARCISNLNAASRRHRSRRREPGHRPAELGEPGPSALALRRRRRIRPRPRPVHSPLGTYTTTGVFHRAPRADLGTERRLATQAPPGDAGAFNGLAHVLAELGRREEALSAARRATELAGALEPAYRATLMKIENQLLKASQSSQGDGTQSPRR